MDSVNEYNNSHEQPEGVGEPFTDAEIADFIERGGEAPTYHPILQVWREIIRPARDEVGAHVTPQWATRITASYAGVTFADMERFRDLYLGKVLQLLDILELEIDGLEIPFEEITTPEADVETYTSNYHNLLLQWQLALLQWELDWETTSPDAAVEIAAIAEVHKMFFGQTGLTQYLDNIRMEYTEADQALVAEALTALKEGR